MKRRFILLACSSGGHLAVARRLINKSRYRMTILIVTDSENKHKREVGRVDNLPCIYIPSVGRNVAQIVKALFLALYLMRRCNTSLILSTGATIGIPFLIAGRLRGVCGIFIDSPTRVLDIGLSGKIASYITRFYYTRHRSMGNGFFKVFPVDVV